MKPISHQTEFPIGYCSERVEPRLYHPVIRKKQLVEQTLHSSILISDLVESEFDGLPNGADACHERIGLSLCDCGDMIACVEFQKTSAPHDSLRSWFCSEVYTPNGSRTSRKVCDIILYATGTKTPDLSKCKTLTCGGISLIEMFSFLTLRMCARFKTDNTTNAMKHHSKTITLDQSCDVMSNVPSNEYRINRNGTQNKIESLITHLAVTKCDFVKRVMYNEEGTNCLCIKLRCDTRKGYICATLRIMGKYEYKVYVCDDQPAGGAIGHTIHDAVRYLLNKNHILSDDCKNVYVGDTTLVDVLGYVYILLSDDDCNEVVY
jgi:hypothetical protein